MKKPSSRPAPRQTKLDAIAESVAHDFAHANSHTINSRRRVLEFEAEEIDNSITAIAATLDNVKKRRATIQAMLTGLAQVIGKR